MPSINWQDVVSTLGSTAIVVAGLAFLAKGVFNHLLSRDLEGYKVRVADDLKQRTDSLLLSQKNAFDRQMEAFKLQLANRSAKTDRIRDEVIHWANPILGAIGDLQHRLNNILKNKGYQNFCLGMQQHCLQLDGRRTMITFFRVQSTYLVNTFAGYEP